jgi:hypothetical protein
MAMENDPLEAIYYFVERAYVRLQAGDLLFRCMEERDIGPMRTWVDALVFAGPQNLDALREILAEVAERQAQSDEDLRQVLQDFKANLRSFGVRMPGLENARSLERLTPVRFLAVLREQGIAEEDSQVACLQLLRDARELVSSLASHEHLLDEVETYLEDWLWGLVYQSARQDQAGRPELLIN